MTPSIRLLTASEVATRLGVQTSTVHAWIFQRSIPHVRISGRLSRIPGEVEVWLQARIVRPELVRGAW